MSVIYSMTGYAREMKSNEMGSVSMELRSVNHRYHELFCRLPQELSFLETELRLRLKSEIARGKLELRVNWTESPETVQGPHLDLGKLRAYRRAYEQLAEALDLRTEPEINDFWDLPDLLTSESAAAGVDVQREEALRALCLDCLDGVLSSFQAARAREGEVLRADLLAHLDSLSRLWQEMSDLAPSSIDLFRQRLLERLETLLAVERPEYYPEERIASEIAIMADKLAIDEELVRLGAHFQAMREKLQTGGSVGKPMDFLVQEMNREINTIASKANHLKLTQICLEMKNLVEKIREQLQNIE